MVPFGLQMSHRGTECCGRRFDPTQIVARKAETQKRREANLSAFSVNWSVLRVSRTETSSPSHSGSKAPANSGSASRPRESRISTEKSPSEVVTLVDPSCLSHKRTVSLIKIEGKINVKTGRPSRSGDGGVEGYRSRNRKGTGCGRGSRRCVEFHREFNTNVLGPLLVIRESLKSFGPGGARVINIGSGASRMCPPGYSIYAASKSAVDAITGVLARELAPRNIRVNSINPGATQSEGTQAAGLYGVGSEFEKRLVDLTPLGRIGTPADIAKIATFLASDDSGWLTGEVILASGGLR